MRALAAILVLTACDGTPLERSCAGASVGLCAPYELAEVTAASLEPEELVVADFTMRARIRVELARCAEGPAHVVDLGALVPGGDGGEGVRVMSLLTLSDGADGDVPGDGAIDVDVVNPFIGTVPPESDVVLRFTPRSTAPGGCTGTAFEQLYRTGRERD